MKRYARAAVSVAAVAMAAGVPLARPAHAATSGTSSVQLGAAGATGTRKTAVDARWLAWNAKTHTATLTLVAGYSSALGGFNFNGYGNGKMVISVPIGTHLAVHVSNKGQVAHSAIVTSFAKRTSTSGFPLAFRGASTTDPTSGIMPGQTQRFSFVASKAGTYALVCGVPGHEEAGMWDVFKVTAGGRPSITTR